MPDWKRVVRDNLGSLPLEQQRRDEVIEELAEQLASAYDEALAEGLDEQEAMRSSMAQFKDWEKLRRQVFCSLAGTRLPVWEQNGTFAPRRVSVWMALALTLLLLAMPSFRQALAILPVPGSDSTVWSSRIFSERALRRMQQSGDNAKYARALAFVALHSPPQDHLQAMHAAEKAIALDPGLTWISAKVSHATDAIPGYDPHPWIERLKAWDPQNGFPYLLEADANVHWWARPWTDSATASGLGRVLGAEPRWRIPMEKAFAASRMDFYSAQQFALDRQVLQEQGFDRPDLLIVGMWSQTMPDLVATNFYVAILLRDVGEKAEKSGRIADALAAYESVARFAERLERASSHDWLLLPATRYRKEAFEKMSSLIERQGRGEQSVELAATRAALLETGKKRPLAVSNAVADRSGHMVQLFGLLVILLSATTVAWLVALSALRWKPHVSPGLNRLASMLSAAPVLLLLSSVALLLGYYPYARSIAEYASFEELQEGFGPFFMCAYGFPDLGAFTDILPRMFWPSVWCAAVALAGACVLAWLRSRTRPDQRNAD